MKHLILATAALFAASSAQAVIISSLPGAPDPGVGFGETVLFDFNSATPELSGNFSLQTGTSGQAAAPAGNTTQYVAVPATIGASSGTATLDLSAVTDQVRRFSFYWGSIDTFNTLELLNGNTVFATITGGSLPPATGNQGAALTNRRVFFTLENGERLTGINFISSNRAFEFDDFATAVPEPASWAMLLTGFAMIGFSIRRRRGLEQAAA